MNEVEAGGNKVTRHESCSDMHTDSLLTEHSVFSPADKGKMLPGEVAEAAEGIIRENCEEPYTIFLHAHRLCILNTEQVIQSDAIMPVGYGR